MKRVCKNLLKIGVPVFIIFFFTANLYQAHAYYGFSYGGYGLPNNVFNGYLYGGFGLPNNVFNGFSYAGYGLPNNIFNGYPYGGYGLPYNAGYPYGLGSGLNTYAYSNPFLTASFSGYSPWLGFQGDLLDQLLNSFKIPLQGIPWNPSIPVEDLYANDPTPTDPAINPYYSPTSPTEYKWFPGVGWTTVDGVFYDPIAGGFGAFTS